MLLHYKNLTIRNATVEDATTLEKWWNDGKIMAHAGFPNGTGEKAVDIASRIAKDTDEIHRRLIIEIDNVASGEMNYRNMGEGVAEIGIKICDFSKHDLGYGKMLLSMVIGELFNMGYKKIILDTNTNNHRAQHVYTELGFTNLGIRQQNWCDINGEKQQSIDYELYKKNFVNFAK